MPSMYDALLKATSSNPEWHDKIVSAKKRIDERDQMERRKLERLQAEMEKKRIADEKRQAEEAEKRRREQEQKNMSELLPFCFTYSHFGRYSRTVCVILAKDLDSAKAIANMRIEEVKKDLKRRGVNYEEWNFYPLVNQMDLSASICEIYSYIE